MIIRTTYAYVQSYLSIVDIDICGQLVKDMLGNSQISMLDKLKVALLYTLRYESYGNQDVQNLLAHNGATQEQLQVCI